MITTWLRVTPAEWFFSNTPHMCFVFQAPDPGWSRRSSTPGARHGGQDPGRQRALQHPPARSGEEEPLPSARSAKQQQQQAGRDDLKAENLTLSLPLYVCADTTVTVSIATGPSYPPVKTEVPSHGFSVTIPNNCAENDGHVGVFDRQLNHNGVQFSPSTQARTPPDSTFSESFKDSSQEVCVSISPFFFKAPLMLSSSSSASSTSAPLLSSPLLLSDLSRQTMGYSPDPMEPAVGSAFPGFIWTCQNSGRCVIMPLSHQHNKVLYFSPTIAKAFSLSLYLTRRRITIEKSNPTKPQYRRGRGEGEEEPLQCKDMTMKRGRKCSYSKHQKKKERGEKNAVGPIKLDL